MTDSKLILGAAISGLICAASHWWPLTDPAAGWHAPKRVTAYTVGGAAIIAGTGVALGRRGALKVLALFAGAGAATVGAYLVDFHLNQRQRRRYEAHARQ
jgi:hypothetical protein